MKIFNRNVIILILLFLILLVPFVKLYGVTPTPKNGSWRKLSINAPIPPGRWRHSAVYDSINNRLIIFGGEKFRNNEKDMYNDVWSLDLTVGKEKWRKLTPSGSGPELGLWRTSIYNKVDQQMIVYGGETCQIKWGGWHCDAPSKIAWKLDLKPGNELWEKLNPDKYTPGHIGHTAIYDKIHKRLVVYGGRTVSYFNPPTNHAYVLNLTKGNKSWIRLLPPSPRPEATWGHAAFYYPSQSLMLIFGGFTDNEGSDALNNVWALDISSPDDERWVEFISSSPVPAPRGDHSLTFDFQKKIAILFGGKRGRVIFNDLWIMSIKDRKILWKKLLTPASSPEARYGHTIIFDCVSNRLILFGGKNSEGTTLNDTWEYSGYSF